MKDLELVKKAIEQCNLEAEDKIILICLLDIELEKAQGGLPFNGDKFLQQLFRVLKISNEIREIFDIDFSDVIKYLTDS